MPQFCFIKVGVQGGIHRLVFLMINVSSISKVGCFTNSVAFFHLHREWIIQNLLIVYALVICNHCPNPHPWGRAGDSHGSERGLDKSFASAVRGKYPGFALYRQKGP